MGRFSLLTGARLAFLGHPGLRHRAQELERALEAERQAVDALERSERRIHRLLDSINEGLVTVDGEGRFTWVNRGFCEMAGYPLEEIVGHHPTEFLDGENKRIFSTEFASRQAGRHDRYEIEWLRKDGAVVDFLVAPQPLYEGVDLFAGSVAVVSDITALKRAERALRTSERQFRELVEYASSIVLRWDVDGTIRFLNPFGLHFFGYTEEEIIGRHVIPTIVPATDSSGADLAGMIADIGAHPERYLYNENETRDSEGRRAWVVWTNRGLRDDSGAIREILSIGTDITELKRTREELARQRDELAELNEFIRRVFGRYVSDAVVRNLLDSPEGLAVGGTTRCATILVADVRGFSSICEELEAEHVIDMLNTYLEVMTTVIEDHGGTIDEFVGDAILVLFGAPLALPDHAERAVACALAMQLAMRDVNDRNRARNLPQLEIGIGVHTGEVVVGNIGSIRRAKYGAVGASVNLAFRLESYTVGGQILISEGTRNAVGESLVLGSCLHVEPKGVRAPLAVYEVLGLRGTHLILPAAEDPPLRLRDPVSCRFFVLEEKLVGRTALQGTLTRISRSGAVLHCDRQLPPLANLKLQLVDHEGEIYAKVVGSTHSPLAVKIRFTSLAPASRTFIQSRLAVPPGAFARAPAAS